ncbi:MAG: hypothetical protein KDK29_10440, partial [Sedimentitalea sp.]|nr:hypothetical protein [Sedimentitalea sp.]
MQAPFLPVTTLKAAVKARANLCQAMSEATPVAAMASLVAFPAPTQGGKPAPTPAEKKPLAPARKPASRAAV